MSIDPKPVLTLAPLPTTRRGYGIQLNYLPKDERILYGSGRLVVLRSVANPSDCLLFTEHKANVTVATPSPSQTWVASGDDDGNVLIWSYPSLKLKTQYKTGKTITDIDWDESSTRLVCAGDGSQKAKVISFDSGNSLGEITMHSLPIIAATYRKHRPFRVVTASEDLSVNLYEGPPFKYKESYKGHTRYPNGVRYSPDGEVLVSVGADSRIVVYDGKTLEVKREIDDTVADGHKAAIYAFSFSPDGKQIVTAAGNKQCKLWDLAEGKVVTTFTFGTEIGDMQVGVVWTKNHILSVSLSGAINYLDPTNPQQPTRVVHGHQSTIQSLVVLPTANTFYTSGLTGEITRWTREGEGKWLTGKGHGGMIVSALTLSDGRLHSFGLDNNMRVSTLESNAVSADAVAIGGQPVAAITTQAGVSVCIVAQDKAVVLSTTAAEVTVPLGYTPTAIALSMDEKIVAIGGKDKKLYLYNFTPATSTPLTAFHTLAIHDKPITAIAFSPNNSYLASVDREASIYLHSVPPPHQLHNKSGWRFHNAGLLGVGWSPSSGELVTAGLDHSVIVWREVEKFDSALRVKVDQAHSQSVDGVRWWDERTFITYGSDKVIKVWQV